VSAFGPPWKLGVTGAVAVTAGIAVPGALGTLQGGAEAAVGSLLLAWPHPTLAVVAVVVGALSILAGGIEIAASSASGSSLPATTITSSICTSVNRSPAIAGEAALTCIQRQQPDTERTLRWHSRTN
jgi:hypothetical protein